MHHSNWKWEAFVSGNSNDLRTLTEGRQSPYLVFSGGVDDWLDCPSDNFAVSSIYFGDEDDSSTVSQVAYELLSLFNGAKALRLGMPEAAVGRPRIRRRRAKRGNWPFGAVRHHKS